MKCYFEYCIYQKNNACTLDGVEINGVGMCEHCEMITLDEKLLKTLKQKRLGEIEAMWINTNE